MKSNDRLGLWFSEMFAAMSIISWILITFFTDHFKSYVIVIYVNGWRGINDTMLVYTVSGWLFIFAVISLVVAVFSNLKYGRSILILKRILYTMMCGLGIQFVAHGVSDFFAAIYKGLTRGVVKLSYGLGYLMLILQFVLLALGCLATWLVKEQTVSA